MPAFAEILSLAALIGVAAITPGPNNVAVMSAAARGGLSAALPAIAGVILGSLGMLLLVLWGIGRAFQAQPLLPGLLAVAGCAYLCHLGVRMMFASSRAESAPSTRDRRAQSGLATLFGLQFLNPKAWTLVVAAVGASQAVTPFSSTAASLALLFVVIPSLCLGAWSLLGSAMAVRLSQPRSRLVFDRTMGALLIASAALLLLDSLRTIDPLTRMHWSAP